MKTLARRLDSDTKTPEKQGKTRKAQVKQPRRTVDRVWNIRKLDASEPQKLVNFLSRSLDNGCFIVVLCTAI